jgi:hypothetical protein
MLRNDIAKEAYLKAMKIDAKDSANLLTRENLLKTALEDAGQYGAIAALELLTNTQDAAKKEYYSVMIWHKDLTIGCYVRLFMVLENLQSSKFTLQNDDQLLQQLVDFNILMFYFGRAVSEEVAEEKLNALNHFIEKRIVVLEANLEPNRANLNAKAREALIALYKSRTSVLDCFKKLEHLTLDKDIKPELIAAAAKAADLRISQSLAKRNTNLFKPKEKQDSVVAPAQSSLALPPP